MKAFVIFSLLFALFFQTLSRVLVLTDYLLNTDLITAKYCINKSKPKMQCKGKCHLTKQLMEQEKQVPKDSAKGGDKDGDGVQWFLGSSNSMLAVFNGLISVNQINDQMQWNSPILLSVFHPPSF